MERNESYIKKLVEDGIRIDGRPFDQFREVSVEKGVITSAEGSAEVRIGKTHVIAGVKMGTAEPYPDTPDEGNVIIDVEFVPFASAEFESGPPSPEAVEIARVVDRGIRECKAIDTKALCITAKEKVWTINIDIHVIDYDGNLFDACSLAAIAALTNTKVPKYDAKEGRIVCEPDKQLKIDDLPIEVTVYKISGKLLLDANAEEIDSTDARLTIATTKNGDLCAMQKGGEGYLTSEEIKTAVELSLKKGKELRKLL